MSHVASRVCGFFGYESIPLHSIRERKTCLYSREYLKSESNGVIVFLNSLSLAKVIACSH